MAQCKLSISSPCLNTDKVLRHFAKHDLPLKHRRQLTLGRSSKRFLVKDNPPTFKKATSACEHSTDAELLSLEIFDKFFHCFCKDECAAFRTAQ